MPKRAAPYDQLTPSVMISVRLSPPGGRHLDYLMQELGPNRSACIDIALAVTAALFASNLDAQAAIKKLMEERTK